MQRTPPALPELEFAQPTPLDSGGVAVSPEDEVQTLRQQARAAVASEVAAAARKQRERNYSYLHVYPDGTVEWYESQKYDPDISGRVPLLITASSEMFWVKSTDLADLAKQMEQKFDEIPAGYFLDEAKLRPHPSHYVLFNLQRTDRPPAYKGDLQASTRNRADVLFGSGRVRDGFNERYPPFNIGDIYQDQRQPFRLVPSEFIRRARKMRLEKPEPTVSAFASWLYSLYSNVYGNEEDRERGTALEPVIFERRKIAHGCIDDSYLRCIRSEWCLVHNGLHLPGQDNVPWFSIDHLRVNGEPLRASPDLIYRHPRSNEVMIVEIKHSFMEIPSNLWPNLWGQLWCYSQLDIARSAHRVTVVGEVWGERRYRFKTWRRGYKEFATEERLHMRACERRDPREPAYDRFFRTLFEIYCGHNGICEPKKTPLSDGLGGSGRNTGNTEVS